MFVAVAVGVVFGGLLRLGDSGPAAVGWVVNIAAPWLAVAFVVGRLSPSVGHAVARSSAALVAAVATKYVVQLAQGDIALESFAVRCLAWGAAALTVSATIAPGGYCSRTRAWPSLALMGLFALEALAFLTRALSGESAQLRYHGQTAGTVVFAIELTAALTGALAIVLTNRRRGNSP